MEISLAGEFFFRSQKNTIKYWQILRLSDMQDKNFMNTQNEKKNKNWEDAGQEFHEFIEFKRKKTFTVSK